MHTKDYRYKQDTAVLLLYAITIGTAFQLKELIINLQKLMIRVGVGALDRVLRST